MIEISPKPEGTPAVRRGVVITAVVVACLVLAFVLYGMKPPAGKEGAVNSACPNAAQRVARLKPLVHGEVAAFALASEPKAIPDLSFDSPEGTKVRLADFKGQAVLLNLWATWCVPCRQEMPALDRLQGTLGSKDFTVLAVNIDTTRLDRPKAFLNEIGVKNLKFYADNTAGAFQSLKQTGKVLGLPTTILIDKDGCEIGTLAGPAQWDSPDAVALLRAIQG
ncbi:thiol:disulfide interchange protein [Beijerinckiaceae bacterium]|nr:thiol:disulfide interchange protein [Beijerinckiaceae bacterium]